MRRRIAFTFIAAVCIGLATACAEPANLQLDQAKTMVEYKFRDSSVPPQYHRSYTIKASEAQASITVDSYGEVLRQESAAMPAETWSNVLELAATLPKRSDSIATPKPGCAGGTASKIIIRNGGQEQYSKSAENCSGGSDQPLTDTATPLEELFDMKELLRDGD